jgi:hypothetical protein
MRSEMMLTLIIFLLLFLKLGQASLRNESVMNLVNGLLAVTLAMGFFISDSGELFGNMFRTNDLLRLEKNMLTPHHFTAIIAVAEASPTCHGVLPAYDQYAVGYVLYAQQCQPAHVLSRVGVEYHSAGRHGQF